MHITPVRTCPHDNPARQRILSPPSRSVAFAQYRVRSWPQPSWRSVRRPSALAGGASAASPYRHCLRLAIPVATITRTGLSLVPFSNIFSSSSSGIPEPLSLTLHSTAPSARGPLAAITIFPRGVCNLWRWRSNSERPVSKDWRRRKRLIRPAVPDDGRAGRHDEQYRPAGDR